jgi:tetratricopeptide (TPR) repeat protein
VRVNGNGVLLRTLLSNGIPVLIETWLEEDPDDGMGHYRLLTGYDDYAERWIAYDSYVSSRLVGNRDSNYQGIYFPYGEMDEWWAIFNRTYVLIYPPEQATVVEAILGEEYATDAMYQAALQRAEVHTVAQPNDPFGWFNLGSTLVYFGRYGEAAAAFDRAREIGLPWRMLWYQFEPFAAYVEVERHDEVVDLVDRTMRNVQTIEELYYWKGRALVALGEEESAALNFSQALALNPIYTPAREALSALGY